MATYEEALNQLRASWTHEGFPDVLDETLQIEVFCKADEIVNAWKPVASVDPDEVVFEIANYIGDNDSKLWAFCCGCALHWSTDVLRIWLLAHFDACDWHCTIWKIRPLLDDF